MPLLEAEPHGEPVSALESPGRFKEADIGPTDIDPVSPWQNGHLESFHNHLRDECLNHEILLSLTEAEILIKAWRHFYNRTHPHSRLRSQSPDALRLGWRFSSTQV